VPDDAEDSAHTAASLTPEAASSQEAATQTEDQPTTGAAAASSATHCYGSTLQRTVFQMVDFVHQHNIVIEQVHTVSSHSGGCFHSEGHNADRVLRVNSAPVPGLSTTCARAVSMN